MAQRYTLALHSSERLLIRCTVHCGMGFTAIRVAVSAAYQTQALRTSELHRCDAWEGRSQLR